MYTFDFRSSFDGREVGIPSSALAPGCSTFGIGKTVSAIFVSINKMVRDESKYGKGTCWMHGQISSTVLYVQDYRMGKLAQCDAVQRTAC
jgi:hypothetical protein